MGKFSKWEILLVKRKDVQKVVLFLEKRYLQVSRLRGIQQIHSLIPLFGTQSVQVRRFSSSAVHEVFYPYGAPDPMARSTGEFPEDTLVAVLIDSSFHLGIVRSVDDDEGMTTVKFMKRKGENEFVWPKKKKVEVIPSRDILGEGGAVYDLPNGSYALEEDDLQRIAAIKESRELSSPVVT